MTSSCDSWIFSHDVKAPIECSCVTSETHANMFISVKNSKYIVGAYSAQSLAHDNQNNRSFETRNSFKKSEKKYYWYFLLRKCLRNVVCYICSGHSALTYWSLNKMAASLQKSFSIIAKFTDTNVRQLFDMTHASRAMIIVGKYIIDNLLVWSRCVIGRFICDWIGYVSIDCKGSKNGIRNQP